MIIIIITEYFLSISILRIINDNTVHYSYMKLNSNIHKNCVYAYMWDEMGLELCMHNNNVIIMHAYLLIYLQQGFNYVIQDKSTMLIRSVTFDLGQSDFPSTSWTMVTYSYYLCVSAFLSIANATAVHVEPVDVKVTFDKSTGDFPISLQGHAGVAAQRRRERQKPGQVVEKQQQRQLPIESD